MHLGYVDAQGRLYDLTFRATKRRLRDREGDWVLEPGEAVPSMERIEAALFLGAGPPHLLLKPTAGSVYATDRRMWFVAGDGVERTPEEPTAFQVSIRVPPTAVDHLLRAVGGREVVELLLGEIRQTQESRSDVTLEVEAPWIGGGDAAAAFRLVLRPRDAALRILGPLRL